MQFSPWRRALTGCLLSLALICVAHAQSVRGTVRLANSAAAAYSIVLFLQNGQERARVITDSVGNYYVERLRPGTYEAQVLRGGRVVSSRTVQVPASGVTIDLRVQ